MTYLYDDNQGNSRLKPSDQLHFVNTHVTGWYIDSVKSTVNVIQLIFKMFIHKLAVFYATMVFLGYYL